MPTIIGQIIEWMIKYACLGVTIALGGVAITMFLLGQRERVMEIIKSQLLTEKFEQLCEFSNTMNRPYRSKRLFGLGGRTMWLSRLFWQGVMLEGGLMVLWILVVAIR
jgi:hypothetical protein